MKTSAKTFRRLMMLFVGVCIFCSSLNAQISDSLRTEMRKVSDQLFHSGNRAYMEIDALCDAYLAPGTKFIMKLDDGQVILNDNVMPPEYYAKLQDFNSENYRKGCKIFFVTCDGITLKDIFDPHSTLRAETNGLPIGVSSGYAGRAEKIDQKKIINHLISMMAADGIVDTADYMNVRFDHKRRLIVNDKKIDDFYAWKYAIVLKEDGFDIVETIGSIWYNNNYRKQHL